MSDEYELVPLNPIRRLERKIEELEKNGGNGLNDQIIEMVKTNQKIVDDLAKMNVDTVKAITELKGSIQNLVDKLSDFLNRIDVIEEEPTEDTAKLIEENKKLLESHQQLLEKIEKIERKVNALVLSRAQKNWPTKMIGNVKR